MNSVRDYLGCMAPFGLALLFILVLLVVIFLVLPLLFLG